MRKIVLLLSFIVLPFLVENAAGQYIVRNNIIGTHGKGIHPMSIPLDSTSECTRLHNVEYNESIKGRGESTNLMYLAYDTMQCAHLGDSGSRLSEGGEWRKGYDTLRLYIENCAMQYGSWGVFSDISGDLGGMDTLRQRFVDGREWFKKVLYYNPDSNYYCSDVLSIIETFTYFEGRGTDYLGYLSVIKFLKDNHKCPSHWQFVRDYDKTYRAYVDSVISIWRDTVKNSIKTPLDTTLPSIDDLGLGILRGQNGVVNLTPISVSTTLGEASLIQNPFHDEDILRYRLNRNAMVRIDVYDALGRKMAGDGEGYKHEGEYRINFNTHSWASGAYYIRLSTMSGEVKTIKLIHE